MNTDLRMGRVEWLLLFVLATMWGGSFFFAKIALQEIAPMTLVFLRVSIGAIALLAIIGLMKKTIPMDLRTWGAFFVMGLLNNLIPFALLFWGQTKIASGLAAILNGTVPIFTVLVAHFFTRDERFTVAKGLGIAAAFTGTLILIGVDVQRGADSWSVIAMFGCLLASLSYGFAAVYAKRFKDLGIEPLAVAFGQVTATTIILLPVMPFLYQPGDGELWQSSTILSVLALALISTALAYVIYFRIIEKGGATNASLVAFLFPVSAVLLGTTFLGERLFVNHVLGMIVIFIGLAALDDRVWAWLTAQFRTTGTDKARYKKQH